MKKQEAETIQRCGEEDFQDIYEIINDAAQAYKGEIPEDRWTEPYMPLEELRHEILEGVEFWGYYEPELVGVMGVQDKGDVALIRHAYVLTWKQGHGIGGKLMEKIKTQTDKPMLVGTWKAATWAIRFYGKHGFKEVDEETKNKLLRKYWRIPERQIEESTVLTLL
ncbi:MAG: GNAT family N-acetyltransferase [Candidatus Altiarchaeota archaeon]|nr:GNAT family N-acetyltransferase [Candidatus Altiarchaeota archaeon]